MHNNTYYIFQINYLPESQYQTHGRKKNVHGTVRTTFEWGKLGQSHERKTQGTLSQ